MQLCDILFGGRDEAGHPRRDILAARVTLQAALGLSRGAAEFLALACWWQLRVGARAWYKFNEPCAHAACRPGDSWCEALGLSRPTLDKARAQVATKITTGTSRREIEAGTTARHLVRYWTDADRLTWYEVNLEQLACRLAAGLALDVDPGNAAGAALPETRSAPCVTPSAATKKEGEGEEGEAVIEIASELEAAGVWEAPAREIAQRAAGAGLDGAAVVGLLAAHTVHAARSPRVRDPLAAAVGRLRRGPLAPPRERAPSAVAETLRAALADAPVRPRPDPVPGWWQQALRELRGQMTRATYERLLGGATARREGAGVTVVARDAVAAGWLARRWETALAAALGAPVTVVPPAAD